MNGMTTTRTLVVEAVGDGSVGIHNKNVAQDEITNKSNFLFLSTNPRNEGIATSVAGRKAHHISIPYHAHATDKA